MKAASATSQTQTASYIFGLGRTNAFLLFVLLTLTFYPLFSGGVTTYDDAIIAINWGSNDVWELAKIISVKQGRFSFLWGYLMLQVPYAIDERAWYLVMKFGSATLLLMALYFAVYQVFRSVWIALASLIFFLAFIQNGWDHNALTSYPVAFNLYAVFFLLSLGLFAKAIDSKNLALAGLSAGLYFFALGIELFVLFFPFYVVVLVSRGQESESVIKRIATGKNYVLAVALALASYLILYVSWMTIHPTNYDGNKLNGPDLISAIKVVVTYSLQAFPIASVKFMASINEQLRYADSAGLSQILSELNASHVIKIAVVGFLFIRLVTTPYFKVPQNRTLIIGASFAVVGIFLPNLLLGFIQKHQEWVASGSESYLYTYYSFISATVFLALVLAYINVKSLTWHPALRAAFIITGVVVVMVLSLAVEVRNQYIAFDQKLSHRKWQLMDEVINSPSFLAIPEGSTVVAPTLTAHQRGIAAAPADYWTMYTKNKTGKNVNFVADKCKLDKPCYALVFQQESHSDGQFVVLAKNNQLTSNETSELTIYSMPYQVGTVLIGSFLPSKTQPELSLNGVPMVNVGTGMFISKFSDSLDNKFVQTATIKGNVEIPPDRVTISSYNIVPFLQTLSDQLAKGIDFTLPSYPDFLSDVSGMAGYEPWARWTDGTSDPVAKFHFKQPLPRKFILDIKAVAFGPNNGLPVKVRVAGVEKSFVITPRDEAGTYRLVFETDGTGDTVEIVPPKPTSPKEIMPGNGDSRKLGIALIALKIR